MHMKNFLKLGPVCNVMNVTKQTQKNIKWIFVCYLFQILKIIRFFNWCAEEHNRVSRNYWSVVDPWKFYILKISIFAVEASLLGQISVSRTSNFRSTTISREFLDRNTLLFKKYTIIEQAKCLLSHRSRVPDCLPRKSESESYSKVI